MPIYGTIEIDWKKRELTLTGMEGDGRSSVSFEDARAFVAADAPPDTERYAVVWWEDVNQLCHYDLDLLESECGAYEGYGDKEKEDEGEESD